MNSLFRKLPIEVYHLDKLSTDRIYQIQEQDSKENKTTSRRWRKKKPDKTDLRYALTSESGKGRSNITLGRPSVMATSSPSAGLNDVDGCCCPILHNRPPVTTVTSTLGSPIFNSFGMTSFKQTVLSTLSQHSLRSSASRCSLSFSCVHIRRLLKGLYRADLQLHSKDAF